MTTDLISFLLKEVKNNSAALTWIIFDKTGLCAINDFPEQSAIASVSTSTPISNG